MTEITKREKIPPQNLEAEMSLLGSVLLDKEAMLKIVDGITPEDFYKKAHAKILFKYLIKKNKGSSLPALLIGTL